MNRRGGAAIRKDAEMRSMEGVVRLLPFAVRNNGGARGTRGTPRAHGESPC